MYIFFLFFTETKSIEEEIDKEEIFILPELKE